MENGIMRLRLRRTSFDKWKFEKNHHIVYHLLLHIEPEVFLLTLQSAESRQTEEENFQTLCAASSLQRKIWTGSADRGKVLFKKQREQTGTYLESYRAKEEGPEGLSPPLVGITLWRRWNPSLGPRGKLSGTCQTSFLRVPSGGVSHLISTSRLEPLSERTKREETAKVLFDFMFHTEHIIWKRSNTKYCFI